MNRYGASVTILISQSHHQDYEERSIGPSDRVHIVRLSGDSGASHYPHSIRYYSSSTIGMVCTPDTDGNVDKRYSVSVGFFYLA